ncbi:sigma-70 family RNA polymerase sigma factor [Ramlibacter humi]|nr:sigma-70 family RNA polymerase sigma factor [Ramlibacter humi]
MESNPEHLSAAAEEEAALWRRLRDQGDAGARERLLEMHMPYARVVAGSYYARRYHDEIEFGDYLQYASVGLLEAMERYEPGRGAQFRTFAARRMHGAILNGLERLTEKQQQISARQRVRAERMQAMKDLAREQAGLKPGAAPRTTEQLFDFIAEVGLGLALAWVLEGTSMVEDPDGAESVPFYREVEVRQLRERLLRAIEELPPQERTVIRSHYIQEVPFEQVASTMGVTRGRISQVHKQALLRLRSALGGDAGIDVSF